MGAKTGRGKKPWNWASLRQRWTWLKLLETDLDKKDRVTKVFQLLFPWIVLVSVATVSVLVLMLWEGWDVAKHLLDIWVFYTLPPAGKETIIPKAVAGGVPPWVAGPATSIVDSCVSLFLIWNYDWVKKIPILGPAIKRAEEKGRKKVEKAKWFKRTAFLFTTLVVLVPFSGSGGFGGTIFGRVLGMNPYKVLLAVVIGSLIGSTAFAMLSKQLVNFLEGTPVFDFLNNLNMIQIVIVIIAVMFLVYAIRNPKKAAEKTTKAVDDAFGATEKAIKIAEEHRKKVMKGTIKGAKNTMKAMGDVNRALVDLNLEVATKPMELIGSPGRKFAVSTKKAGKRTVDDVHKKAGKAIDQAIDAGEKATNWTVEGVQDLTLEGLGQTRKAWGEAGKVMIKGGEKMEGLMKKKPKKEMPEE
ncbi:MAG: small multi-drug export protein [Thermoplasmatota archaeon]